MYFSYFPKTLMSEIRIVSVFGLFFFLKLERLYEAFTLMNLHAVVFPVFECSTDDTLLCSVGIFAACPVYGGLLS